MSTKEPGGATDTGGATPLVSTVSPMRAIATEIQVIRNHDAGWHVYTCEKLPGLYVASKDDRQAYDDLPNAIRMLFKLDYRRDVVVQPKVPYETFVSLIEMGERAREAVETRTRDMLDSPSDVLSFLIGSTEDVRAAGRH